MLAVRRDHEGARFIAVGIDILDAGRLAVGGIDLPHHDVVLAAIGSALAAMIHRA